MSIICYTGMYDKYKEYGYDIVTMFVGHLALILTLAYS